ncbi:hypothetical protein LDENG_00064840 [Lucifuga dentata]|nr:hypothetical protein LDENG_00064840 [Lucifuga dentata]
MMCCITAMVKTLLVLLLSITALVRVVGLSPLRVREKPMYVKEGEMVALLCSGRKPFKDANVTWTGPTITQETDVTSNKWTAEKMLTSLLFHGRNLVILNASVNHQGNYSCTVGNSSSHIWFKLTVLKRLSESKQREKMSQYSNLCFEGESCKLKCPDPLYIPNLTSTSTMWHTVFAAHSYGGETSPASFGEYFYFESVAEKDRGVYTCTRSYLYHGRLYNMTRTTLLDVQTNKHSGQNAVIISPGVNQVFHVDLDSPVVIDCKAVTYLSLDEVFWLNGNSIVEMNDSLPLYYNYTQEENFEGIKLTASLVFQKVSKEDLSQHYTCKLGSCSHSTCNITIFLAQKDRLSCFSVVFCTIGIMALMVVTVVIYVKLKIDIVLFLRDTLGCYSISSDGKHYDAYLMYFKSDTGAGLHDRDRKWLENVLEEKFGYTICLYDRDVLPGKAAVEAVLDCIEQSRTVVLIPTSRDPVPGPGLQSAVHAALVERQTRLVLITTETTVASGSAGSVPEALQLLGRAGHSVTWKGVSSWAPSSSSFSSSSSSSFWKQLRYHLPAPHDTKKVAVPKYIKTRY